MELKYKGVEIHSELVWHNWTRWCLIVALLIIVPATVIESDYGLDLILITWLVFAVGFIPFAIISLLED